MRGLSDTSDDFSDNALESESGGISLPNGIPASSVEATKDVSSIMYFTGVEVIGALTNQ